MVKANLADKPKRPMSAYFLWMNGEGRADVKKKNFDKEYKAWLANGGEELLQEEKNAKKKGSAKGKAAPKRAAPKKAAKGKKKAETSDEEDQEQSEEEARKKGSAKGKAAPK